MRRAVLGAVALAAALAAPVLTTAAANAATASTGAGIGAWPVCSATPLVPGRARQLQPGGLGDTGVSITNTGSASEALTLSVGPLAAGSPLAGRARAVAPSWVSFGYPRSWLVLPGHSVTVAPGSSAAVPVTVTVPPGTPAGAYAASLTVSTGASGTGGAQLGAGAATLLVFTVGQAQPAWPPLVLAATGTCWDPPGTRVPWQEWAGTSYATAPPGWHWQAGSPGTWAYTPPPGWYYSWVNPDDPHQVYRGGTPVVQCANPGSYPDPAGGDEIGGQYPVTSTAAGCAAWLAASSAGTLGTEPALGGHQASPGPRHVTLTSSAPAVSATSHDRALAIATLLFIGAAGLAVRAALWLARQRRRHERSAR